MTTPQSPARAPRLSAEEWGQFENGLLSKRTTTVLDDLSNRGTAVTFDELTLEDLPSDVHPNDASFGGFVTKLLYCRTAVLSAAMDTVTEGDMALELARAGGVGILHRNLDAETQARMVKWVRRKIHSGGMIDKPIAFHPDQRFSDVQESAMRNGYTFTSFPVVERETNVLLGMITRDEMDFVESENPHLSDIMKGVKDLVTGEGTITTGQAYEIMVKHRVKKLPCVKEDGSLLGMYVWNDVRDVLGRRDMYTLDDEGHFLVGAAIGLGPAEFQRAELLVNAGCRLLVLDSSHGACKPAVELTAQIKKTWGDRVQLIVGNIASYASAKYLLTQEYIPDGLKVGIGPGSICTTRRVTGHGVPQVTALYEVTKAVRELQANVPVIADGGIRTSGDVVKCLAVGASAVMLGSVLAGTDESPGHVVTYKGKKYKQIRGMGSRAAMAERSGSRARYHRQDDGKHSAESLTQQQQAKMVPEGVEGLVELKGSVVKVVNELKGGVGAGLAHSGARDSQSLQRKARIWVQSTAGVIEGNPHNLVDIRG